MKKGTQYIIMLVIAILVVAGVFGLQSLNKKNAGDAIVDAPLENGLLVEPITFEGEQYLVPPEHLYENGAGEENLPTINEPVYTTVGVADEYLADGVHGLAVEVDGQHRFYSYQIMNWHVVVNDEFNGKNLAITHCFFCRTPRVYETDTKLRTTDLIYNNNFVLADEETDSLWLQESGIAISGQKTGANLKPYPSEAMKWEVWKELYPDGEVLSTDTGIERDYARHPFGAYDDNTLIYFPLNQKSAKVDPKWIVDGVEVGDRSSSVVFPRNIIMGFGVANENINNERIVAIYDYDNETTRIFNGAGPEGDVTLTYDFDEEEIRDEETNSLWNTQGLAIAGELEGTQLERLDAKESMWFCWASMHDFVNISGVGAFDANDTSEEPSEPEGEVIQVDLDRLTESLNE